MAGSRTHEVAARLAFIWESSRLVGYQDIALPQYLLTLDLLLQERKPIPAIEEFVLRSIDAGLHQVGDVGGLLGLDARLTQEAVLNQLDAQTISFDASAVSGRSLRLTSRGRDSLQSLVVIAPTRRAVPVVYDRLTLSISAGPDNLLRPRDLDTRSVPGRSKEAPKAQELSVDKVAAAVARAEGGRARRDPLAEFQLLAIRHVARAERRYRPAVLLVYERNGSLDYGIAVDGRPSGRHTAAIAELGGLSYLEVDERRILQDSCQEVAREQLPEALRSRIAHGPEVDEFRRQRTDLLGPGRPEGLTGEEELVVPALSRPEWRARDVPVWEQALLFAEALKAARRRLLICADDVTPRSADYAFANAIEVAASRGVAVDVVVRLSARSDASRGPGPALARIQEVAERRPLVRLHRTDAPGSSTLIWDDTWIAGSFPWLAQSGRGAGLVTGTGVLVTDADAVESAYGQRLSGFPNPG